ncbi:hypothetical protein ALC60_06122, partial [Trachymyrmex zeteki]
SIHANVYNYMVRSIVTWLLLACSICQWRNQDRKKHTDYNLYMHITNDSPIAHAIIIYDETVNVENSSWQNGYGN